MLSTASVKDRLRRIAVSNIYLYAIARKAIRRLPFMLPHEPDFHGLKLLADETSTFLDVGANDGLSALSIRTLCPRKPILSIEPNPVHEPELAKLKSTLPDFTYRICGAGRVDGTLSLFTPTLNGFPLTNYTSFSPEAVIANLEYHMRIPDIGNRVKTVAHAVDVMPLDAMAVNTDLIKIDVEGAEDAVLDGLAETIGRCRPSLMIEYNALSHDAVAGFFAGREYACHRYLHASRSFVPLEGNFPLNLFWLPRERSLA
jgi:FkbM family methyltransferase